MLPQLSNKMMQNLQKPPKEEPRHLSPTASSQQQVLLLLHHPNQALTNPFCAPRPNDSKQQQRLRLNQHQHHHHHQQQVRNYRARTKPQNHPSPTTTLSTMIPTAVVPIAAAGRYDFRKIPPLPPRRYQPPRHNPHPVPISPLSRVAPPGPLPNQRQSAPRTRPNGSRWKKKNSKNSIHNNNIKTIA